MDSAPVLDFRHYTIAWIAPLEIEFQVAWHMLDNTHQGHFPMNRGDDYHYLAGDINGHNIIIATLPYGQKYGVGSAAALASQVKKSFPNLWFGLLVGVAAGLPDLSRSPPRDIRLGDVLVGLGKDGSAGLLNYGLGKETDNGFELLQGGALPQTEQVVRSKIGYMRTSILRHGNVFLKHYEYMKDREHADGTFADPGQENDHLYDTIDDNKLRERAPRNPSKRTIVWYGTIGSGNTLMKNAKARDQLRDKFDLIGLEMEAAGTMDTLPVGVIRGVSDYGDMRKNKQWQPYAAAIAAAYAKEILCVTPAGVNLREEALKVQTKIDEEQTLHIDKLPYVVEATPNSIYQQYERTCLADTRVALLEQIRHWATQIDERCIFWLNGMAGMGKSTIARTIAHEFCRSQHLAASFFFSRDRRDVTNANRFFTTIARQLTKISPDMKRYICEAVANEDDIAQQGLSNQWKTLIFQPISRLKPCQIQHLNLVFVIDALDECENRNDIERILHLLSQARELKNVHLRILVTSRPEPAIHRGFQHMPEIAYTKVLLHEIPPFIVYQDIFTFFMVRLREIQRSKHLPFQWPGKHTVNCLVQRASGLFIFAALVCRYVEGSIIPQDCLAKIIECGDIQKDPTENLNDMYIRILQNSLSQIHGSERAIWLQWFQQIVGTIIVTFDLVSIETLSRLLLIEARIIKEVLGLLQSVVGAPETESSFIRLLHLSFRDFLLDAQRCKDERFLINEREAHRHLYSRCILLISSSLKRNICDLPFPGAMANKVDRSILIERLPSHLQYACRYWVGHLKRLNCPPQEYTKGQEDEIRKFLHNDILKWLEALSLMGVIAEGIRMITELQFLFPSSNASVAEIESQLKPAKRRKMAIEPELSTSSPDNITPLGDEIQDVKQFILYNRSGIEQAPLQVYSSALVFSPQSCLTRQWFIDDRPKWLEFLPTVRENWGGLLHTFEGHSEQVSTLLFSPNGQLLASASEDGTVRLWEIDTGTLQQTFKDSAGIRGATVFSPDGQFLALISQDYKMQLWDPITGILQREFECWPAVDAIAFSKGKLLTFCSQDNLLWLWNVMTSTFEGRMEGHSSLASAVVISPDGSVIGLVSKNGDVRLWEIATNTVRQLKPLEKKTFGNVNAMAFSYDGQLLALGFDYSDDHVGYNDRGEVQIWDSMSGTMKKRLDSCATYITAITFAPYGIFLALGSVTGTIQLWSISTTTLYCTFQGHSDAVRTLAFSSIGQLLASGYDDGMVQIWNVTTKSIHDHSHYIGNLKFSPDGQLLVSAHDGGSKDARVDIWDATARTIVQTIKGDTSGRLKMKFSPDSRLLALGFQNGALKLWCNTSRLVYPILGAHTACFTALSFSPSGSLLASGFIDSTLRIWDTTTGTLRQTLKRTGWIVGILAFSPEGHLLASSSNDRPIIELWCTTSFTVKHTLIGHSRRVLAFEFSPCRHLLVSGSKDGTIRLWDLTTGSLRTTLDTGLAMYRFAFSHDGKHLITKSWEDSGVRLLDVNVGAILCTFDAGVSSFSFSADGSLQTNLGPIVFGITPLGLVVWSWSTYSLSRDYCWITWKGFNVLWLPPEYRPSCNDFRGNTCVMGNNSSRVMIMGFSSTQLPIDNHLTCKEPVQLLIGV